MKTLQQLEQEAIDAHNKAATLRQEQEQQKQAEQDKEVVRIGALVIAKLSEETGVLPQELKEVIKFSTGGYTWNGNTPAGLSCSINLKDHFQVIFKANYSIENNEIWGLNEYSTYYHQRYEYNTLGKALAKARLCYQKEQEREAALAVEETQEKVEPPAKLGYTEQAKLAYENSAFDIAQAAALISIAQSLDHIIKNGLLRIPH